jgi:iron complex transport system substrate-binding protein
VRIASLVPSATEMLFALGLGDQVVAVTHECDYPPEAAAKPHLTRSVIPGGLEAGEIDAAVREAVGAGRHLYELDEDTLRELEVDLIVTQAVCEVCAVSYDDVRAVASRLPTRPDVLSLDPVGLDDVLSDVTRLGQAAHAPDAADRLRRDLESRLAVVREAAAGSHRPRVVALEWLDPPFVGGHWVPEMIQRAGGEDVAGRPREKSRTATWEELAGLSPDVVVAMPCGWDADRAVAEVQSHRDQVESLAAERVFAVDAAASFSRPGPRLVEGTELLAHLMAPDRVDPPAGVEFREALAETRTPAAAPREM